MDKKTIYSECGSAAIWRVTGERALAFLHSMLTQDVGSLQPGEGAQAALLDDKGRLRAIVRVFAVAGSSALIECDPGSIDGVESGLARLAPLGGVGMERDDRVLIRVAGDPLPGLRLPNVLSHAEVDRAIIVRTSFGMDVLVEPEAVRAWKQRLDQSASLVDPSVIDAYRIRAGLPFFGIDVNGETLINETPLVSSGVSFTKGCYPGQETVARIRNLGGVRKRLVVLRAKARPGAEVLNDSGTRVGRITSSAIDDEGEPAAFAVISAEAVIADRLHADGEPSKILSV